MTREDALLRQPGGFEGACLGTVVHELDALPLVRELRIVAPAAVLALILRGRQRWGVDDDDIPQDAVVFVPAGGWTDRDWCAIELLISDDVGAKAVVDQVDKPTGPKGLGKTAPITARFSCTLRQVTDPGPSNSLSTVPVGFSPCGPLETSKVQVTKNPWKSSSSKSPITLSPEGACPWAGAAQQAVAMARDGRTSRSLLIEHPFQPGPDRCSMRGLPPRPAKSRRAIALLKQAAEVPEGGLEDSVDTRR
jgi:hypothetical protein